MQIKIGIFNKTNGGEHAVRRTDLVKQEMSNALKEMCRTQALSSITVSALMERCGFSRGTFYYHFIDLYDLINWTFETEIIIPLKAHICEHSRGGWADITRFSLEKMFADKDFYSQAVRLDVQNGLREYMLQKNQESWDLLIEKYLKETNQHYDPDTLRFLTQFVSQAIGNMIIDWASKGMQVPVELMCKMNEVATMGIYGLINSENMSVEFRRELNL